MADLLTSSEYLTVATIPLATPAWRVQNLGALLSNPDVRGADRLIPHANGARPYRRRITVTQKVFPVVVNGFYDRTGAVISSGSRMGLIANVEILKAAFLPVASTAGTTTATWTRPDASTKTAAVHVVAFDHVRQRGPNVAEFSLVLSIPGGMFA